MCFDKTGTLTSNEMEVSQVYAIVSENDIREITKSMEENDLISDVFASCNSVEDINGEIKGD